MGRVAVRQVGERMSEGQALASVVQAISLVRDVRTRRLSMYSEAWTQARRALVELSMLMDDIATDTENAT